MLLFFNFTSNMQALKLELGNLFGCTQDTDISHLSSERLRRNTFIFLLTCLLRCIVARSAYTVHANFWVSQLSFHVVHLEGGQRQQLMCSEVKGVG